MSFFTSRIWVLLLGVVNTFVLASSFTSNGVFLLTAVLGSVGLVAAIVLALICDVGDMG